MNSEFFKSYRQRILDNLRLLSSVEEQIDYQASVHINVPDELLCMWFDDLNMPESLNVESSKFNGDEVTAIKTFSEKFNKAGVLIRRPNEITLEELLKHKDWQDLVVEAASLLKRLTA